ncbi:MAG: c-type cytochrome biogenesis protein CcmI [Acetobacteraceae bacterium]
MLWVLFAILSAAVLAPIFLFLQRGRGDRGRQAAALALHRAQLVEVDRECSEGRIGPTEHQAAVLEIERRILTAGAAPDLAPRSRLRPAVLTAILLAVPLAALGLYLPWGDPGLPAAPIAPRLAKAHLEKLQVEQLVATLKHRLKELDPKSAKAREGLLLLGRAEADLGDYSAAAAAWRRALETKFDPALAAAAAEAETRAAGRVDARAAELFRASLAKAPANAPWSALARARLAEAANP